MTTTSTASTASLADDITDAFDDVTFNDGDEGSSRKKPRRMEKELDEQGYQSSDELEENEIPVDRAFDSAKSSALMVSTSTISLVPHYTKPKERNVVLSYKCANGSIKWSEIFQQISIRSGIVPDTVRRAGHNMFEVRCSSEEEAAKLALHGNFPFGQLVTRRGVSILYFYRMSYHSKDVRVAADLEERIIASFAKKLNIVVTSITVNEVKKCITIYFASEEDWDTAYTSAKGSHVIIPADGPFKSEFALHAMRTTAATNHPQIFKFKALGVPEDIVDDTSLLACVRHTCGQYIPMDRIIGMSIFSHADSNRLADFGFGHVKGEEFFAQLLKIRIPFGKKIMHFKPADEQGEKRKRDNA